MLDDFAHARDVKACLKKVLSYEEMMENQVQLLKAKRLKKSTLQTEGSET